MRKFLLTSLILCLASTTGCMVLDEMDAAAAKMPTTGKKKTAVAAAEDAPTGSANAQRSQLLEQSKQWWDRATSLAPTGLEASIVSCRMHGGTQFMSKDDCLSRGGTPTRV